ncbi:E3 ubiquitin-protein ligase RNF103-like [Antedon mediterranea]|uniref:E3 ubiquitin-protein ligase RNF103-like n=1 Tax=Antedon mediterranea TaxID=105859 RepID=UPI003AF80799
MSIKKEITKFLAKEICLFIAKVLFIGVFMLLLSFVLRKTKFWSSDVMDPTLLNTTQLKKILDRTGVDYDNVVTKIDLANLVDQSGEVLEGALYAPDTNSHSKTFRSSVHFNNRIANGVWVIQIVPSGTQNLMTKRQWEKIERKANYFHINTATVNCTTNKQLCDSKQWNKPSILLVISQSEKYIYESHSPEYIFGRINNHLKPKVTRFYNPKSVWQWMDKANKKKNDFQTVQQGMDKANEKNYDLQIKVAYFSKAETPPLFFTRLANMFSGMHQFAFISTPKRRFWFPKSSQSVKVPSIVILTPEGQLQYGNQHGEFLEYRNLYFYIQTLNPDVFYRGEFLLYNSLCLLEFCLTRGGIFRRLFFLTLTSVKYVILSIIVNILFSLSNPAKLLSYFMWYIRNDLLMYSQNPVSLLVPFLIICSTIGITLYLTRSDSVSLESNQHWVNKISEDFYLLLLGKSRNEYHRPEYLRHKFWAMMGWLRFLSPDYIGRLPTGEFDELLDDDENDINGDQCCICLDLFSQQVCSKLPCNHIHHKECIKPWLELNHICPKCRWPAYIPKCIDINLLPYKSQIVLIKCGGVITCIIINVYCILIMADLTDYKLF